MENLEEDDLEEVEEPPEEEGMIWKDTTKDETREKVVAVKDLL